VATMQNTFDSGTAGTSITAGNSGGANGDAFAVTGSGRTFNADAMHGALSADFLLASGDAANYAQWSLGTTSKEVAVQFYFKLVQNVTATSGFFILRGGGSAIVQLAIKSDRTVDVLVGSGSTNIHNSSALTLGTWYRFDLTLTVGTTTSNGVISMVISEGDSLSAFSTMSTNSSANLGTVDADQARVGWQATVSSVRQARFDSLRVRTAEGTTALAPFGANAAPTISVTANQNVSAGATVTVNATALDTDGSIASYAWNVVTASSSSTPSLTGASTATLTFTAPAAGNLVTVRCVVTDDDGATAEATTEVRVPKTGDFSTLALDGTTSGGTWTRAGAASTDGAALADALDSTYTQSPSFSASETYEEYRLEPLVARSNVTFTVRALQPVTGGTVTVRLVEGTTVRQSWTLSTISGSAADIALVVDNPAAISDWGNLRLRVAGVS